MTFARTIFRNSIFWILFLLSFSSVFAAEGNLLPLQGSARLNNAVLPVGDLIIEVYDAPSGGNLVYNSSQDFLGVIRSSRYDIVLGNTTQPLWLNYGTKYYMDMYVNGTDIDFNGSERQVFESSVGNISVSTPIQIRSNDSDDALNVSGGTFLNGTLSVQNFFNVTPAASSVRTNGTVAIDSSIGFPFSVNKGFNITNAANLITNGSITIQNTFTPVFTINNGFNITGANSDLFTNGTIIVRTTRTGPALTINDGFNITAASGVLNTNSTIAIDTNRQNAFSVNRGFNITGAANNVVTNGTITIQRTGAIVFTVNNAFNITGDTGGDILSNGTARFDNNDTDNTINLTQGGLATKGQISIQNYTSAPAFTVNYGFNVSGANEALTTNGTISIQNPSLGALGFTVNNAFNITSAGSIVTNETILTRSTRNIAAFSVNDGFNISGTNQAVITNGSISIQNPSLTPAFTVNNGFNVSGVDESLSTNGTVAIRNSNTKAFIINDGFNISGVDESLSTNGTVLISNTNTKAFVINDAFNVSGANNNVATNGTVRFESLKSDDSLNISAGGFTAGGGALNDGAFRIGGDGKTNARNNDPDDAFNLSAGGLAAKGQISIQNYTSSPAFTVNYGFNISGADESTKTNGSVAILISDNDDALNVTGAVITGGPLRVGPLAAPALTIGVAGAGLVVANAADTDDAVNITAGGLAAKGQISIQNYTSSPAFTVNYGFNISGADEATRTNGTITILNIDSDDAFNISGASIFKDKLFISGNLPDPIFTVNKGFNISASNGALTTNGTVTILNTKTDDALNISGGLIMGQNNPGSQFKLANFVISDLGVITTQPTINANGNVIIRSLEAQALNINSGFNVSGTNEALKTNGTITITNNNNTEALNVSGSIFLNGTLTIGSNATQDQHGITVGVAGSLSANSNKCAYISLVDEGGNLHYIFFNTSGVLRVANTTPATCEDGINVGNQS